jgi:hypothetical protein
MFVMTNDIIISQYAPFKCTGASWNINMDNYADSGKITMPALCKLKKQGDQYDNKVVQTAQQFTEGMPVQINCGYNGNNVTRFKGFIKRINFTTPLEVECEGYSYQLRKASPINKTYANSSLKKILQDLIEGTDIKLSDKIPDVPVSKIVFQNYNRTQVLDWLKEKMLMTVYFSFDVLYVGLRYTGAYGETINHRLNWNVIKDNDLLFNADKEFATVNIRIDIRKQTGEKKKYRALKPGNEKILHATGIDADAAILNDIRNDHQQQLNYKGYTGKVTSFLEPVCTVNDVSAISDGKYAERSGNHVIEAVEGEFSQRGGRQKILIGISI